MRITTRGRLVRAIYLLCGAFLLMLTALFSQAAADTQPDLADLLDRIDQRYQKSGFSAYFVQQSTLKALDIVDVASGKIYIQRPGKMHWAYTEPEEQAIISDGENLWIYRPLDNQVTIGKAPTMFGAGRGASFLSDIKTLKESFEIEMWPPHSDLYWQLKLNPRQPTTDLDHILIRIQKSDHTITHISTINTHGDRTDIELISIRMDPALDPKLFKFEIPEGTDVIRLD